MKKFEFVSQAAMKAYLALPKDIQYQFGADLNAVQQGSSPAYRAIYCVKYLDTVFVLHAFEKTTNGVDRKEMVTAAKRYKEMKNRVDAENKRAKASITKRGK